MQQNPTDRYKKLKARYEVLEQQKMTHLDLLQEMLTISCDNPTDLVIIASIKRSLDLIDGITFLTDRWNFAAAAPLLRLQIDSLIRLAYLAQLKDPNAVSKSILEGKSFRELKDSKGKSLTDARLRKYARPFYPWLDRVYEETSKLIHLSDKHLFLPVESVDDKTRTAHLVVEAGIKHWPESEIDNFLDAVGCTTDALLKVVLGWVVSKHRAHKDNAERNTDEYNPQ